MGCINSKYISSSFAKKDKDKLLSEASDIDLFSDYFSIKKTKEHLSSPNVMGKRLLCHESSTLKTETGTTKIKSTTFEGTDDNYSHDINNNTFFNLNTSSFEKTSTGKISNSYFHMKKSLFQQNIKGIMLELKFIDSQKQHPDSNVDTVTIHQQLFLKDNDEINKSPNSNQEVSFIFGKSNNSNKHGSNGASVKNDYGICDSYIEERQFEVIYNIQNKKFYIGDLNEGNGIFNKILTKQIIHEDIEGGMIITFCNCYLCFEIQEPKAAKQIKVSFLDEANKNRLYLFSPLKDKQITFGRSKIANVIINQSEVSRIQCTLIFENNNWVLYNGYIDIDNIHQISTNGIFLQIKTKIEVEDGQIFKTGKTLIFLKLIETTKI